MDLACLSEGLMDSLDGLSEVLDDYLNPPNERDLFGYSARQRRGASAHGRRDPLS